MVSSTTMVSEIQGISVAGGGQVKRFFTHVTPNNNIFDFSGEGATCPPDSQTLMWKVSVQKIF